MRGDGLETVISHGAEADWPAWATETIHVAEPDPQWRARGQALRLALFDLLCPWLAGDVQHVGSTSVPGLPAKPIIDLMAGVRALNDADAAAKVLAPSGWSYVPPELDQRPWHRLFVLVENDRRAAHLHLVEAGHPRLRDVLVFRDRLRSQPGLAAEYARLKRRLARQYGHDREAYTAAKAAFVQRVIWMTRHHA